MRRFAACLLAAGLALAGAACGSSQERPASYSRPVNWGGGREQVVDIGPGPLVLSGGLAGGSGSGLWGDGASGPDGTRLGCIPGRHYSEAFGLENRSRAPVTLTGARGPNPAPAIVDLVAIQLRLSPPQPPPSDRVGIDLVYRRWSDAPTRPVTIPPGRIATVQSNFVMRLCRTLAPGRSVVVPGSLDVDYRTSGHVHHLTIPLPSERLVVVPGPTKRICTPVPGSASLVASDTACRAAREAARACHPLTHGSWGDCTVAGVLWDCSRFAGPGYPLYEVCYLPHAKAHSFRAVWLAPRLTLWGAFRTVRGRSVSGGDCSVREGVFTYESDPLRLGAGFGVARVKLVLPLRPAGRFDARLHTSHDLTAVRVVIRGSGVYTATAGRVTITSRTPRSVAGNAYASLSRGGKRISLNGAWSCRTG